MRVLPYGARAALVELNGLDEVLGLYHALRADPIAGIVELVPAARALLVRYDPRATSVDALRSALVGERGWGVRREEGGQTPAVEVPVIYDGPDLREVARLTGLDEADVVRRHTGGRYRSGFCGFVPGFAYLTGLDPSLVVPRRDDPRIRVRAGSVGLAAEFTAIYPRDSPGGWQLIGHTELRTWELDRDPPTLLGPGTPVLFVDAGR